MHPLKIIFFGTPEFSVPTLRTLLNDPRYQVCAVVTQPDKPAGRGQSLQASAIKLVAQEANLPVFQPVKIRGCESQFLESIASLGAVDFGVVIAFGQILPQQILDYPKYGCINIHASLLPRWRGAAPIQRAMLAGDKRTGVCIMKMEAGLDTGPVYQHQVISIEELDNSATLHDRLSQIGGKVLVETLPKITQGALTAVIQPEEGVTYAEKIKPSDYLIDWNSDSQILLRTIKTFTPKPGAFCFLDGKRFKVLKAEERADSSTAEPGKIMIAAKQDLIVKTKDASLKLIEVQLEGKKAMSVEEFLKGQTDLEGKILRSSV